ncbi:MAG: 16S rRNA (cytidine(1402)-2'-O)-methyltransferase [Gemmatimonadaceae bacterium]
MSAADAANRGTLFVVSTPIGNLGDLSPRAVEVLGRVGAILAEDTRHSRVLCDRYALKTPLIAHHGHNEAKTTPGLVARLLAGESLALITDAGTPLVSDPGARIVRAAIEAGVTISPIPGASALLAALAGAGLPTERFTFYGFLERRGGDRSRAIAEIVALAHTAVLHEAPGRVAATLADLAAAGAGNRDAVVARELTKTYEEFRRGTVADLAAYYGATEPRGEIVLVIAGAADTPLDEDALRARAESLRAAGRSAREITQLLMAEDGAPRNLAYRLAHE